MNYLYYLTWDYPRRGTTGAYTGRFVETRWSPEAVILSAAKDLSPGQAQILRCAQDDTSHLAGSFPTKPTRVSPTPVPTASRCFSGFIEPNRHHTTPSLRPPLGGRTPL